MVKDAETKAYLAGYRAAKKEKERASVWMWILLGWMGLITAATAFSMFFLLGAYINDYFCW